MEAIRGSDDLAFDLVSVVPDQSHTAPPTSPSSSPLAQPTAAQSPASAPAPAPSAEAPTTPAALRMSTSSIGSVGAGTAPSSPTFESSAVELLQLPHFKLGSRVNVHGYSCPGTVRFAGVHPNDLSKGARVLVELDIPLGKNNGVIDGHLYYEVAANHGVLCVPRKVSPIVLGAEPDLLPSA